MRERTIFKKIYFNNVEHGSETIIGSAKGQSIDVDDIKALGMEYVVNEVSALIHEVAEQCLIQIDGKSINAAHLQATIIESVFSEVQFDPADRMPEKGTGNRQNQIC